MYTVCRIASTPMTSVRDACPALGSSTMTAMTNRAEMTAPIFSQEFAKSMKSKFRQNAKTPAAITAAISTFIPASILRFHRHRFGQAHAITTKGNQDASAHPAELRGIELTLPLSFHSHRDLPFHALRRWNSH